MYYFSVLGNRYPEILTNFDFLQYLDYIMLTYIKPSFLLYIPVVL